MKEYIKPEINEELFEIEDVIALSGAGNGEATIDNVEIKGVWDIFTK